MKHLFLCILLVVLFTKLLTQDLFVNPNGDDTQNSGTTLDSPFKTVSHAMDIIESDPLILKTIYMASGEYSIDSGESFPIMMKSHVTLQGAGASLSIFIGVGLTDTYVDAPFLPTNRHCIIGSPIYVENFKIRDIGFENWGLMPVINQNAAAIRLWSFKDFVIENCLFQNGMIGLTFHEYHLQMPSYGAFDFSTNTTVFFKNLVFRNLIKQSLAPLAKECIFENIIISGQRGMINPETGHHISNPPILFEAPYTFDGTFSPPYRRYITFSNLLLYDNVILANDGDDFGSNAMSFGSNIDALICNATITNNLCSPSPSHPYSMPIGSLRIAESSTVRVYNSIIYDNSPNTIYMISQVALPEPSSYLYINNTLLHYGLSSISNAYQLVLDWGEDNLTCDPLFDNSNYFFPYQLSPESSAIGAGMLDLPNHFTLPETDIMGNPRITNGEIDMGAYQKGSSADYDETLLSARTALLGNYPNPFNPETTISFQMVLAGKVRIDILNIKGQKIRTVFDQNVGVGSHKVVWNGVDDAGRGVSSGIYFYQMQTGSLVSTKKMVLIK